MSVHIAQTFVNQSINHIHHKHDHFNVKMYAAVCGSHFMFEYASAEKHVDRIPKTMDKKLAKAQQLSFSFHYCGVNTRFL